MLTGIRCCKQLAACPIRIRGWRRRSTCRCSCRQACRDACGLRPSTRRFLGRRLAARPGWVLAAALALALGVVPSLRNLSGMLIHDFLCHRDHAVNRWCHDTPSGLAFWDAWRGFTAAEPSYFLAWLRSVEGRASPLQALAT